jgi:(p)ppGpp synthase/HD superfamily hydrolase
MIGRRSTASRGSAVATTDDVVAHGLRIPESLGGLPLTRRALAYAERLHAGQRRAVDGVPFIAHPLEVACLLYDAGAPDHVIAAGILHDVLEKTDADPGDLQARFGARVAVLVLAVSEDKRIAGYARRKAALRAQVARAGREALMVFAADKISKARELRLQNSRSRRRSASRSRERERRLDQYCRCLRLLEESVIDSPLVGQLRMELERAFEDR